MHVKICADSTCDLSAELVAKYNIGIVPLYIVKGGDAFKDSLEIKPQDIYDYVKSTGDPCTTAAVSVGDYIDYFTEQLKDCDAIVHLTISSEMSACYQNLVQASEEFPGRVFPVDARNLSTGIGQLALTGAELAAEGVSAADIQAALNEKREKLDVSFVLDTLFYLHKGGRCSPTSTTGSSARTTSTIAAFSSRTPTSIRRSSPPCVRLLQPPARGRRSSRRKPAAPFPTTAAPAVWACCSTTNKNHWQKAFRLLAKSFLCQ